MTISRVDLGRDVAELTPSLIALRRTLHERPELAFEEVWTAATLAERMRALGLPVRTGIGGTGVVALLEGARPGLSLLVRADMDGLPMEETTGRPYASKRPNRNHACGHDAHSAIVAVLGELLARHRDRIAGRVAFVFQPADEPMRGARRMIDDGLLEWTRPDASLALHVLPMAECGQAVVQAGPLWASRDELTLGVDGPPTVDFARVAAELTAALYRLVETEGRSAESVTFRVRSLTAHQAGPAWLGGPHAEPSRAALEVNLATHDNALRARLLAGIHAVARAIVESAGATIEARVDYALPVVANDEQVTAVVERAARQVVGPAGIIKDWRNPFSDDVGLLLAAAPGCLLLLGTASPETGITEIWHRPAFDIDEEALPLGLHIMALAALDLLR